ncbi:MAG: PEP-CTERM sorting domain-containing protein [Cyanobacteria bacterium P01_A01_bin.15]
MGSKKIVQAAAIAATITLAANLSQAASAATMSATLTADNHYALFTGNANGTDWNFIGRNEKGAGGVAQDQFVYTDDGNYDPTYIGTDVLSGDVSSGGRYNWSMPESWTYNINPDDYLYVVVWDDSSVTESWIGQFVSDALDDGMLLSQADSWEYLKTVTSTDNTAWGINPGDQGDTPELDDLSYQVSVANAGNDNSWLDALKKGDNGDNPWGDFSDKGISAEADFLYTTTDAAGAAGGNNQNYTIFRTRASVIENDPDAVQTPEPGAMVGLAAVGLLALRRKLKQGIA